MDYPKSARVRKRQEYLNFFQKSDVKRLDSCTIFRIQNNVDQARLGITVKSRVNSVYRNKLKRQIKEVFRLYRCEMKSFDYNVVVPGHIKVDYQTPKKVRQTLERIWAHANIF